MQPLWLGHVANPLTDSSFSLATCSCYTKPGIQISFYIFFRLRFEVFSWCRLAQGSKYLNNKYNKKLDLKKQECVDVKRKIWYLDTSYSIVLLAWKHVHHKIGWRQKALQSNARIHLITQFRLIRSNNKECCTRKLKLHGLKSNQHCFQMAVGTSTKNAEMLTLAWWPKNLILSSTIFSPLSKIFSCQ